MSGTAKTRTLATILDVAREAGVSRTTVSRVLNEPDRVPAGTVARVREAVDRLNYRPSQRARSLRTGRTDTIALLVGDVSQPFQGALSKEVARAAEERGLNVLLCDLDHSEARLLAYLAKLPLQGVDGIIIATGDAFDSIEVLEQIEATRASGIPVILSGRSSAADAQTVTVDFRDIARHATRMVLDRGYKSPALLVGRADSYLGAEYIAGYTAALDSGLRSRVLEGDYSAETSADVVVSVLSEGNEPDAIIAATATMALGVIGGARRLGRRVPDDVAIVVCEDVPLASIVVPALTTVGVPPGWNGLVLVDVLERWIGGDPGDVTALPYRTVLRETLV